jgi:hypothetical protein
MTTDPPTPFTDDDLSADLDGEVTSAVHDAIEDDPAARARRAELARARALVASSSTPSLAPDVAERLLDAAIDAADRPLAPVAPLRRWRGPAPWQVAAAVILLVAVGLSLVYTGRDQVDDLASTAATSLDDGAEGEQLAGGSEGLDGSNGAGPEALDLPPHGGDLATSAPASRGGVAESAGPEATYLGSFGSADELRAALALVTEADQTVQAPAIDPPSVASLDRCDDQIQVVLEIDAPASIRGYALVDGRVVLVYEYARPSFADGTPTTLVVGVGVEACEQVITFER